ncbi:2-polyprenyl-3-methyl-5-hydroxy-6-metoxy-1,4-benzoquinol methylase [Sphingobium lactosutens]|uniref:class I SAM-dependent methyltransferase n=1 Tax=Sphingobium lactosutens TaxID=522773 RepID=UPI0015BAF37F|nr:class I SAM-dependent methyltransferase [Sphingobium lactosutens]NWK94369.1 2-polyprenyl-3-methyl-5-hydroxy-6-metoxy-1,4-benzoquinol methylase [Sphingobium lactosutens]
MDGPALSLFACPRCGGRLDSEMACVDCAAIYEEMDGIAGLRLPGDDRTERVRGFYMEAPFPGYPPRDTIDWLRARAERSHFARQLDAAIPTDAHIVEVGCGTGQMSLYLARSKRIVIAADLCRASLALGRAAAQRLGIDQVRFVETDIYCPGLRAGAFDIVYCSGVLHHTPDPGKAFGELARLARPGGLVIVGLYNRYARLPHRARRLVARLSGWRWFPPDRVLADRKGQRERHRAWLQDQYRHPEEHRHTLAELRRWFAANGIDYVRSVPSALVGGDDQYRALIDPEEGGWWLEDLLAQFGWMASLGGEGGLFIAVGRARERAADDDERQLPFFTALRAEPGSLTAHPVAVSNDSLQTGKVTPPPR